MQVVALVEASKGVLVLVAGWGLLTLLHHDAQRAAEALVRRFHLDPARRYPQIFVQAVGSLNESQFRWLALGAGLYAAFRFVEAYGLWRERAWAEWLAVVTAGVYVPLEIVALARGVSWPKLLTLAINLAIVLFLARALQRRSTASEDSPGRTAPTSTGDPASVA